MQYASKYWFQLSKRYIMWTYFKGMIDMMHIYMYYSIHTCTHVYMNTKIAVSNRWFEVHLRGDPCRKSLCATPLKFNYVIKRMVKGNINAKKNFRVGFINKEGWPPEETPLWRPKSAYDRHFEIFYNVEIKLLNTTWNRFWFENLYW
jgi:hypothetical protein